MKLICIKFVLLLVQILFLDSKKLLRKHLNKSSNNLSFIKKIKFKDVKIEQSLTNCKNVGYQLNGILKASCIADNTQTYYPSTINLNFHIGNNDGKLMINGVNFTKSCRNIRLDSLQQNGVFYNEYRLKGECQYKKCEKKKKCKKFLLINLCDEVYECSDIMWLNNDLRLDSYIMSKDGKLVIKDT